jgi:hypothetical protein
MSEAAQSLVVKPFFAIDTQTYQAGALGAKIKELLGGAVARLEELPAT